MTQDTGPEDQGVQNAETLADEQPAEKKRSLVWPWLALAILLLLVIWLIWQYVAGTGAGPDAQSTTVSSEVVLTPGGNAAPVPTTTDGEVATAAVESRPTVPDVVGMSRAAATAAIRDAGYSSSVTVVIGTTHPAGTVFQQNPTGGAALEPGGTVGLLVQQRPTSKPTVKVPNLTGLSQAQAESKLKALGIRRVLSFFPDASDPGRVQSQWPLAGDRVEVGGEVQIQITVKP